MKTIPLRPLPELCSGTGAVGSAAGGGYGNCLWKKMLSQAHQKHTLGGEGGKKSLRPWTANSWEGLGVAWRLASRPLPSPVQMGEVRLRLAAAYPHPPPLHFPNFPFPLRRGWRLQRKAEGGRKAKEHDCSVFHPNPPSDFSLIK